MTKLTTAVLSTLLITAFAAPAFAQDGGRSLESYSREMSIQYSMLHDYGRTGTVGVLVDFGKSIKSGISVIGEFDMHRFTSVDENYTQAAAGVRFGRMAGTKSRAFVQFMVGPQTSFGSTGIAYQPGAGLNVKMGGRVDTKLQVDFPVVRWNGRTYKQARVSVGLGLPFGGR